MIYQYTYQEVLDDLKHQSRRISKPHEYACGVFDGEVMACASVQRLVEPYEGESILNQSLIGHIRHHNRMKWAKGSPWRYSVQPGRGQSGLGFIEITGFRAERLQSISSEDAWDELGRQSTKWIDMIVDSPLCDQFLDEPDDLVNEYSCLVYKYVWNLIHPRKGERWADNPLVWIIDFKVV